MTDQLGSRIKLHDLRIFMAVVQAGSMGRAARQLHVAQPNISNSVANLERALGVRLLDRGRQGVAATPYGRAVIDCGVAIFDDLRQGLSKIRFLADPTAGEVRIGTTVFLAAIDFSGPTVVADLPEVRIGLLATGRFLTIFPASVLKFPARREGIKVLPVELPVSSVPVGIVTLKNRTLSPVAQIFREYVHDIAKPLAKQKG